MENKKALITGSGQDASILAKFLLDKNYKVWIGGRRCSSDNLWRLKEVGILDRVNVVSFDLLDYGNIMRLIGKEQFDEVYNLGAMSFVQESFNQPINTLEIDARGCLYLLEAIRTLSPNTKFYQASSSEMFGKVQETPQKETTPFYPRSPYGIAKLTAHWFVVNYREAYKLFMVSGILFNHESELRSPEFVTKKITNYVHNYNIGDMPLQLGNINAKRDWGYANDYVEAMWLMLQQDKPDDFVISTGESHSIKEFCELAFKCRGYVITWVGDGIDEKGMVGDKIAVEINEKYYRPSDVDILLGCSDKAREVLKWKSKVSFEEMIKIMINY